MNPVLTTRSIRHIIILQIGFFIIRVAPGYCHDKSKILADSNQPFAARMNSALAFAIQNLDGKKFWLLYSIRTTKTKLVTVPALDSSNSDNRTLYQLLVEEELSKKGNKKNEARSIDRPCEIFSMAEAGELKALAKKDAETNANQSTCLAIILDYSLESGRPFLYQVYFQDILKSFNHESRPIIWLGHAATDESFAWLSHQFYAASQEKFKLHVMQAIGRHDCNREVAALSAKILYGKFSQPLKAEAITLAARSNTMIGLKLLITTAFKNNPIVLRKKAVLALSQLNNDRAHLAIATLAQKEKNREVRKEAIFWLAQVASSKSTSILHEIMQKETDPEIRECALFAISQLPASQSKPMLATIAMNDPVYRIRRKARLMLKHVDEDKFMNFFDELVRDNDSSPIEQQSHDQ